MMLKDWIDRWRRIRSRLAVLDERNLARLNTLKRRLNQLDDKSLLNIYRTVWLGGSKKLTKKRTGNQWFDLLSRWLYGVCAWLDWLDTKFIFSNLPYQAKACRVRSKSEKLIANWLTDHGIRFKYEKPLKLGQRTLHPDFYLPKFDCYIEYWGLADVDPDYEKNHRLKLGLYGRFGIKVISVYPRHLRNFDAEFPRLFFKATGKSLEES